MKKLLLWKHWQVFLLTYGLMFVLYIVFIAFIIMGISSGGPDLEATISPAIGVFGVFFFLTIICLAILYAWFWAAGTGLHEKLPAGLTMNLRLFKLAVVFPLVYIVVIFVAMASMFSFVSEGFEPSPLLALLLIPHLFTIFCMFYIFYFIAKALKSVEAGREMHFGDYIGEFFLLWFFIIGVWFLQPRLNRIFSPTEEGMEKHLVG